MTSRRLRYLTDVLAPHLARLSEAIRAIIAADQARQEDITQDQMTALRRELQRRLGDKIE